MRCFSSLETDFKSDSLLLYIYLLSTIKTKGQQEVILFGKPQPSVFCFHSLSSSPAAVSDVDTIQWCSTMLAIVLFNPQWLSVKSCVSPAEAEAMPSLSATWAWPLGILCWMSDGWKQGWMKSHTLSICFAPNTRCGCVWICSLGWNVPSSLSQEWHKTPCLKLGNPRTD